MHDNRGTEAAILLVGGLLLFCLGFHVCGAALLGGAAHIYWGLG